MIYDCFLFFSELDMLEARLYELQDVPDLRHVLVEGHFTFTGNPKPLYYGSSSARFARWADRITHVVVSEIPSPASTWEVEAWHRECIRAGLAGASPDDLVLLSDCDEIPSPGAIARAQPGDKVQAFRQRLASFAVDWVHEDPWHGTTCAYLRNISSFAAMRGQRDAGNDLENGGWHLSWMGGHEAMRAKLHAFSHTEMVARIEAGIGAGEYLERGVFWGRDPRAGEGIGSEQLTPVDVDETWPRWVRERKCPANWFRPR